MPVCAYHTWTLKLDDMEEWRQRRKMTHRQIEDEGTTGRQKGYEEGMDGWRVERRDGQRLE
jgi:hypothetical protein